MPEFIPISKPSITQKEVEYVSDAVQSGWVSSLGKYINLFEREFAKYCGTKYAITTSSGTTALHLALLSLNIKPGDEVIIPDLTFVATANAVAYTGATVVTVDVDKSDYCISPKAIEAAISKKTKAIIPVHLYGHPSRMSAINNIAKKHNLLVIEDAAQGHGAEFNGKKAGGLGDCAIFSFYGNKVMTSGEGGMITTDDIGLYERMKHLRDHAMSNKKRYWHDEIGFNYRMTNLQAALGVAQLERIGELIQQKIDIFNWYQDELKDISCLKMHGQAEWAKSVHWAICVEVDGYSEIQRNQLMTSLRDKCIDSRPYFYPVSDMPMYSTSHTPVAHHVSKQGICLPSYSGLSIQDIKRICNELIGLIRC